MRRNLLRRLSGQGILIGLFLVFTLPFLVVVHQLALEINGSQEFAARERLGVQYNQALRTLLEQVIEQQPIAVSLPIPAAMQQRASQPSQMIAAIQAIDTLTQKLGASLNTTAQWQQLRPQLQEVLPLAQTPSAASSLQRHTEIVDALLAMVAHVGDTSNLILDPDLDSYYLMDTVVTKLPAMINSTSKTQSLQVANDQQQDSSLDEQVQLLNAANSIELNLAAIQRGLQVSFDFNPSLKPRLSSALQALSSSSKNLLQQVQQARLQPQLMSSDRLGQAVKQASKDQFQLYDVTALELDKLLATRVDKFY